MNQIRANQKAFAFFVTSLIGIWNYSNTWLETNILLKLLQLFFLVGLYFFVLLSFKQLSAHMAKQMWLRKVSVFSYLVEYSLKASFVGLYVLAFSIANISIMKSSDHVKGVAKERCYKSGNFNSCYDYFQLAIKKDVTEEGKHAFKFALKQCESGSVQYCSHFVRMVESYTTYQEIFKVDALDAALQLKLQLSKKALLTEEYSIALAMNGKYEEAIKIQKELVAYAKRNKFFSSSYESRLKKWEDIRSPAATKKVQKKK